MGGWRRAAKIELIGSFSITCQRRSAERNHVLLKTVPTPDVPACGVTGIRMAEAIKQVGMGTGVYALSAPRQIEIGFRLTF